VTEEILKQVQDAVKQNPGSTFHKLAEITGLGGDTLWDALQELERGGAVRIAFSLIWPAAA